MSNKTKKKTLFSTFVGSVFKTLNSTRKNNNSRRNRSSSDKNSSDKNSSDKNSSNRSSRKPTVLSLRTIQLKQLARERARERASHKIAATLKRSFSSTLRKLKENKLAKLLAKYKADETVCSICLSNVEDVKNATITSCNHLYHTDCIEPWLLNPTSRSLCPNCKRVLVAKSGINLSEILNLRNKIRNKSSYYNQEKHNDLIEKLRNARNSQSVVLSDLKWISQKVEPDQKVGPAQKTILSGNITRGEDMYHIMVKMIEIYFDIFPQQKTKLNSINTESDAISSRSIANKNITEEEEISLFAVNGQKTVDDIKAINEEPLLISLKQIAKRILATSA